MLDTVHRIETPENVDLDLTVAGPALRCAAWAMDLSIRMLVGGAILSVFAVFGSFGFGISFVVMFLLEWAYPVWFEVKRDGATPGKRAVGIRVVLQNGAPVGWGASVLRNLLRTADFLPLGYGFGLATMLFSGAFRRLGDLAAGTIVVRNAVTIASQRGMHVPPRPPAIALALADQRTIISFAQRAPHLPPDRARELATIAEPLLRLDPMRPAQSASPASDVVALYSLARWLEGKRKSEPEGTAST
jgi:uncharacterized RDD family membrane protein YckC